MTQTETHLALIRRRLQEGGSITALEALRDYGCYRLASRISDLRREGMAITRKMEESKSRVTGKTVHFARYSMTTTTKATPEAVRGQN